MTKPKDLAFCQKLLEDAADKAKRRALAIEQAIQALGAPVRSYVTMHDYDRNIKKAVKILMKALK